MNKIKRHLAVLVCVATLFAVLPCVSVGAAEVLSGECGDDLTWTLTDGGTLTISGTGDMTNWTNYSSVPWYGSCSSIKTVVIEGSVTGIGGYAFYNCTGLTSVTIPIGVTSIGDDAFYGCSALKSVTIPDSMISIGNTAFYGCNALTAVTIPASVSSIGIRPFSSCSSLKSIDVDSANTSYTSIEGVLYDKAITKLIQYPANKADAEYVIPDSVTSIGNEAFRSAKNLTKVMIPASVTDTGTFPSPVFYLCDNLESIDVNSANPVYTSVDGVLFDKAMTKLIQYPAKKTAAEYAIPDSVTSIVQESFRGNINLTKVTIPEGLTNLNSSSLPAFFMCSSLESIDVDSANPVYTSVDGVLFNKEMTQLIKYPANKGDKEYAIPDSVTSIVKQSFRGSINLTKVTIPEGLTNLNSSSLPAFFLCDSLESIDVNSANTSYVSVDGVLFNKAMTQLMEYPANKADTKYVIPDGITNIGGYAFYNCTKLEKITIPEDVKSIGANTFYVLAPYQTSLSKVYYGGTKGQWDNMTIAYGNDPLLSATLYIDGKPILPIIASVNAKAENGSVTVTAETENVSASNVLIAVGFDSKGEYTDLAEVENGTAQLDKDVKTVKVFVWKSMESMIPLCEAKEVNVQ